LARLLSTATVLGLLIATAAAFAITERLKLEKSPITGTRVSRAFSPVCGCARDKANISVKFRHKDTVTVTVLTAGRKPVRTIVEATPVQRGRNIFRWDGKTDAGVQAPDGTYRVEIHLANAHRTILLPAPQNTIELDTKVPGVIPTVNRPAFSPDGDHQADSVTIHFRVTEPAHVLVYLGDRLLIRSRSHTTAGSVTWSGRVDGHLHPPGVVTLSVGAVDLAGNAIPAADRPRLRVVIRYITLASRSISAPTDSRFEVGVSTDARRYGWLFAGRHGLAHGHVLRLHAPRQPGRYVLVVTAHGHSDRAVVTVR
jgi:FlgD Ig-like domain